MKKFLSLVLAVCLFLLSACTNGGKTQTLEQFFDDANIENVDKVIIQDGSTGYSKTITQQAQIDEFLSLINDIQFTPQDNQECRDGWRYAVTLFDGKEHFEFTLSEIDGIYYDSNPDIHGVVDAFYKQLDIVEE